MPFETKIEYILEQVRLTLQKKDYAQAKVLSRKILLKTLTGFEKADQYKATYLEYLLEIYKFENDYITV
ncbi:proteasome regulatory particle subunit, partial [Exophiala dermatitidis]